MLLLLSVFGEVHEIGVVVVDEDLFSCRKNNNTNTEKNATFAGEWYSCNLFSLIWHMHVKFPVDGSVVDIIAMIELQRRLVVVVYERERTIENLHATLSLVHGSLVQ